MTMGTTITTMLVSDGGDEGGAEGGGEVGGGEGGAEGGGEVGGGVEGGDEGNGGGDGGGAGGKVTPTMPARTTLQDESTSTKVLVMSKVPQLPTMVPVAQGM